MFHIILYIYIYAKYNKYHATDTDGENREVGGGGGRYGVLERGAAVLQE